MNFEVLPDDCLLHIFRFVDLQSLLPLRRVCHRWRCVIQRRLASLKALDIKVEAGTDLNSKCNEIRHYAIDLNCFRMVDEMQDLIDSVLPYCTNLSAINLRFLTLDGGHLVQMIEGNSLLLKWQHVEFTYCCLREINLRCWKNFIRKLSPSLKHFVLFRCPDYSDKRDGFLRTLLKYGKGITDLTYWVMRYDVNLEECLRKLPALRKLEIREFDRQKLCNLQLYTNLVKIKIAGAVGFNEIKEFCAKFPNMEEVDLVLNVYETELRSIGSAIGTLKLLQTLRLLSLTRVNFDPILVNMSENKPMYLNELCLKNCLLSPASVGIAAENIPKLHSLILSLHESSKPHKERNFSDLALQTLTRLKFLKTLDLSGFALDDYCISYILKNVVPLETLIARNCNLLTEDCIWFCVERAHISPHQPLFFHGLDDSFNVQDFTVLESLSNLRIELGH